MEVTNILAIMVMVIYIILLSLPFLIDVCCRIFDLCRGSLDFLPLTCTLLQKRNPPFFWAFSWCPWVTNPDPGHFNFVKCS